MIAAGKTARDNSDLVFGGGGFWVGLHFSHNRSCTGFQPLSFHETAVGFERPFYEDVSIAFHYTSYRCGRRVQWGFATQGTALFVFLKHMLCHLQFRTVLRSQYFVSCHRTLKGSEYPSPIYSKSSHF